MPEPVVLKRREMSPRARLGFAASLIVCAATVVLGWMATVGRQLGEIVHAGRTQWREVREVAGQAAEQTEGGKAVEEIKEHLRETLSPSVQTMTQGQEAMNTVTSIMKEKLYEQTTAETTQTH